MAGLWSWMPGKKPGAELRGVGPATPAAAAGCCCCCWLAVIVGVRARGVCAGAWAYKNSW